MSKTLGRFSIRKQQTTDALRLWARSLAGITGQVVTNDPQVRTLLQQGPDAANEVSRLFNQIKPTLPILLANLTTFGQVGGDLPSRHSNRFWCCCRRSWATILSSAPENNPTGMPMGDFRISIGDPPACTVGFLPPSQWRSPGRHHHDRHAGRLVLQAPTGLADRRAWSA